jgi:hypothetical protein
MKLFLGMANCVCITAVDFKRLEQAWHHKYGVDETRTNTGSEYLDKIFQIKIGIPQPTSDMIKEYIKTLVSNLPDELLDLFSTIGPKNPRSIKKMLNLVSYRRSILNSDCNDITASLWTLLETILSIDSEIWLYEALRQKDKTIGKAIKADGNNYNDLKTVIESVIQGITGGQNDIKLESFFKKSKLLVDEWGVSVQNLDMDFDILYSTTNERQH